MNKAERLALQHAVDAARTAAYDAGHAFAIRPTLANKHAFNAAVETLKITKAALAAYDARKAETKRPL